MKCSGQVFLTLSETEKYQNQMMEGIIVATAGSVISGWYIAFIIVTFMYSTPFIAPMNKMRTNGAEIENIGLIIIIIFAKETAFLFIVSSIYKE